MSRLNSKNTATAAVIATAAVALLLFYFFVDPSSPLMPKCVFKALTGHDCPGCGFQRALHALLHGDIAAAWRYNAFVFFAVPAGLFYVVVEAGRRRWPRFHAAAVSPVILSLILIAILAWWVARW